MLKIRLMRIGGKKRPFYRVVAVDERSKRTGGYIELLGTYNPLTEPKDIKLKQDRIDYWIKKGAQPSVGYLRIIGKAPQRQPRKPKKEKKEESPAAALQPAEAPSQEAPKQEEAKEETKSETAEATGAVESAPEKGITHSPVSQQTRSENKSAESEITTQESSSGASQSDEQSAGPVIEKSPEK